MKDEIIIGIGMGFIVCCTIIFTQMLLSPEEYGLINVGMNFLILLFLLMCMSQKKE